MATVHAASDHSRTSDNARCRRFCHSFCLVSARTHRPWIAQLPIRSYSEDRRQPRADRKATCMYLNLRGTKTLTKYFSLPPAQRSLMSTLSVAEERSLVHHKEADTPDAVDGMREFAPPRSGRRTRSYWRVALVLTMHVILVGIFAAFIALRYDRGDQPVPIRSRHFITGVLVDKAVVSVNSIFKVRLLNCQCIKSDLTHRHRSTGTRCSLSPRLRPFRTLYTPFRLSPLSTTKSRHGRRLSTNLPLFFSTTVPCSRPAKLTPRGGRKS